jgi:hypothetical protein
MANIAIKYVGLTGQKYDLTIDNGQTVTQLRAAIATAEGLTLTYYGNVSLLSDISKNYLNNPSDTLATIGAVAGSIFLCTPEQDSITKQNRQIQKLEIAQEKRQADGDTTAVFYRENNIYDLTLLPDTYNGNVPGADDNPNTGGLLEGRPWVELAAGLYRRTYTGYHGEDVNWFATATQTASGADSTLAVAATPENTSIQWLGYFVPATTETYTFFINSDDGSYLWIGANAVSGFTTGNALINNGGSHAAVELSATIALTAGVRYAIRIQTGNGGGPGSHATSFSTPTIAKTSTFTNRIFYNPVVNGI